MGRDVTLVVVIGGTRSGKSAHAERLALASGLPVRYVATADSSDPELAARIAAHRARRPASWATVEAGPALDAAFAKGEDACVLLDGLGSWIATSLHAAGALEAPDRAVLRRAGVEVLATIDRAVEAASRAGAAIVVAEQAGEGLLPPDAGSRAWLDLLGEATQRFAARAARVDLVVAGRALLLGAGGPEVAGAASEPDAGSCGGRTRPPRPGADASPGAGPAQPTDLRPAPSEDTSPGFAAAPATAPRGAPGEDALPSLGAAPPAAPHRAPGEDALTSLGAAPPAAPHRAPGEDASRGPGAAPASAPRAAPREPGPGVAQAADLRHHGDRDVRPGDADHAVNVVAGGPPAWLLAALERADLARYPDERDAAAAIADLHGRDPDEVVPTNGAAEALWLLPAALRPRLAACVHPAFTEAEVALRAHGVPVVRVLRDPDRDFALDPDAVPAAADLVVVGNPASPSGTLDPARALHALRRPGRVVVVDEAFMDLVAGQPATLVRERLDDVVVVRSATKALAVPGLRAGYAVAAGPLADGLRAVRPPWSANALALAALAAVARNPARLAVIAERVAREREDLAARLRAVPGLRTWPSAANFCLVEVTDGTRLVAALRERRIAVRPAASFPGLDERHIRLTARTPAENARLVEAIEDALA